MRCRTDPQGKGSKTIAGDIGEERTVIERRGSDRALLPVNFASGDQGRVECEMNASGRFPIQFAKTDHDFVAILGLLNGANHHLAGIDPQERERAAEYA